MTNIASLQKLGDSLGVTKQAIDKLFVKKGFLRQNKKGKIDIDDPYNLEFLQSKGADFSVFGIQEPVKTEEKPKIEKVQKIKVTEPKPDKIVPARKESENNLNELEKRLKIENIKSKQKDSELKALKIKELQKELIPKK